MGHFRPQRRTGLIKIDFYLNEFAQLLLIDRVRGDPMANDGLRSALFDRSIPPSNVFPHP
jgi:hypothetical protein